DILPLGTAILPDTVAQLVASKADLGRTATATATDMLWMTAAGGLLGALPWLGSLTASPGPAWCLGLPATTAARATNACQPSCVPAGRPLLTPAGDKPIEQFITGQLVLSRSQHQATGPIEPKLVEEVFVRTAPILNLHIRGRVLGTTSEHPFWVAGRGWVPAG